MIDASELDCLVKHLPGRHDQKTHTPKAYLGSTISGTVAASMFSGEATPTVGKAFEPYLLAAGTDEYFKFVDNAKDEFGGHWEYTYGKESPSGGTSDSQTRSLLRNMYNETQQALRSSGIEKVTLRRGVHLDSNLGLKVGDELDTRNNPISSWTDNDFVAKFFSQGYKRPGLTGYVIEADIPVDQILSFHSLNPIGSSTMTGEWWILGTKDIPVRVVEERGWAPSPRH